MSERQRLCFFIDGLQQWFATELRRREPHDLAFAMVIVERLGDFKQCERPRSPRHERAKDGGDDRSKSGSPKATDDERSGDKGRRRHHKGQKKHGESRKQGDSRDHKAHGGLRRECFYCACPHYGKDCPHKGKMIAFLENHKSSKGDSSRSDGEARIRALQLLCQRKLPSSVSVSLTTRFPESKSCATSTGPCAGLDVLVDHMMLPEPLASTRIPGLLTSFNLPDMSVRGVFLLATQTTVITGSVSLYQIPMYLFLELPGLKNPISKLPPEETIVSPSLID
ncbi:hypothetical protein RJ640_001302 [Escallonia rubra]|uniref:Uncharacterized protein n=1 Tax=Escallonia rubra TaxID=112253 RepID=A0AA88QJ70_9ASTE|nr:hypothetical protein RJ640_001302 [Escallonia rubra]